MTQAITVGSNFQAPQNPARAAEGGLAIPPDKVFKLTDLAEERHMLIGRVPPLSAELFASLADRLAGLVPDNDVSNIWANIEVGGKVVAQIYNSGVITTRSGYALPGGSSADPGPEARARLMIQTYGGRIVMRSEMAEPALYDGS